MGGSGGGAGGDDSWGDGGFSCLSIFVTFVARAEPEFELDRGPCESDRVLIAASPALLPNDNFHLLGFFVTIDVDACAWTDGTGGRGGRGGRSGNVCTIAEAERV
jgi:hypothetical protein